MTYAPDYIVNQFFDLPTPDCNSSDFEYMYLTDRNNRKNLIKSVPFYTHPTYPTTRQGWTVWNRDKEAIYETVPYTLLTEYGPNLFIDVLPRSSNGEILSNTPSMITEVKSRTLSSPRCNLRIVNVRSLPTDGSITAINTEAARLEQGIANKGQAYKIATNYERFIKSYEVPRLQTIATSLQMTFNTLIEAAMSSNCSELPPPPFLPISGFVPYEPATEDTNCDDAGLTPDSYSLGIKQWKDIDLRSMGVIVFDEKKKTFVLEISRENNSWYFEAKTRQPRIKEAMERLLVELTQLNTGIYYKENPSSVGDDFVLPDAKSAEIELRTAIQNGKNFIDIFDAFKELLSDELDKLRERINSESEGLDP